MHNKMQNCKCVVFFFLRDLVEATHTASVWIN